MTSTVPPLHAFLDHAFVPVPHAADGPLKGRTLAVKDIYDVKGYATGRGNPAWERQAAAAEETASAVQALLDAGAQFTGKTQTEEFAYSMIGINAHFTPAVNPVAPGRVTGGSSSGSASAVAGGLADIAVGSDTNSSIRAPAAFCGLLGLRTTTGRIPLDHTMPLSESFDTFGWFARNPALYETVGEILLGEDAHHTQLVRPVRIPELEALLLGDPEHAAFGIMAEKVLGHFTMPATELALPLPMDDVFGAFRKIQGFEAWSAHGEFIASQAGEIDPIVRKRFDFARHVTWDQKDEADAARLKFVTEFTDAFGPDGIAVIPTTPGAAPMKSWTVEELNAYALRSLCMTSLAGFLGWPQITIPLGTVDGAPFGISLMGPANTDRQLIRLARTILNA